MKEINIVSKKRNEMIDIKKEIQELIEKQKITSGYVIIYVPHTTAGVTINEGADPSVKHDIIKTLETIIPERGDYHHSEGNSDAHIKASLIGSSTMILIENKKVVLGTWQHIFFYEGDGPRNRKVLIEFFSI